MAKRKAIRLPRVAVYAMSKRDLVEFVASVETLRLLVDDLRLFVHQLPKKRPAKPADPEVTPA